MTIGTNFKKTFLCILISYLLLNFLPLTSIAEGTNEEQNNYSKLPILVFTKDSDDNIDDSMLLELVDDKLRLISDKGYASVSLKDLNHFFNGKANFTGKKIAIILESKDNISEINALLSKYNFEEVNIGHRVIGDSFKSTESVDIIKISKIDELEILEHQILEFEKENLIINTRIISNFLYHTYLANINDENENIIESRDENFIFASESLSKSEFIEKIISLYNLLEVKYDENIIRSIINKESENQVLKHDNIVNILEELYMKYPIKYGVTEHLSLKSNDELDFIYSIESIIKDSLNNYKLTGEFGLSVSDIDNNFTYSINGYKTYYDKNTSTTDAYFMAASVIKLPLAIAIIDMIEKNEIDIDDINYDKFINKRLDWEKEIYNLISYSDNNPYNSALRVIGREKINNKFDELGMTNFKVWSEIGPALKVSGTRNRKVYGTNKGGRVNPLGMEVALKYIIESNPDSKYIKTLKKAMEDTTYNGHGTRIPQGISQGKVLHKTGTVPSEGIYGDSAIIYGDKTYTITILSQNEKSEYTFNKFCQYFSQQVENHFNK